MPGTYGRSGRQTLGADHSRDDGGPIEPENVSAAASVKWRELLTQLSVKELRKVDVHELRLLCELLALSDALAAAVVLDPTDLKSARLLIQTAAQIHKFSAVFGLNPHDRKRLNFEVEEHDDADEWSD